MEELSDLTFEDKYEVEESEILGEGCSSVVKVCTFKGKPE